MLSECLSLLTYKGQDIQIPKEQLNLYMGIGLWSAKQGLSVGLPVDVMHMLLSATVMRSQIAAANPGKQSKIIILIADSMAVREGASEEKVSQLVHIYRRSLEPLIALLKLQECSEMMLSSELERSTEFQESVESVEKSPHLKQVAGEHYLYVRTQTAITRYMNKSRDVGIKVGWACSSRTEDSWDEITFDQLYGSICQDSTIQYLYAKSGLKQSLKPTHVQVTEGCPYTAYDQDMRYTIQLQTRKEIKAICPLSKRVAAQWKGVAEMCGRLMQAGIVSDALLPKDCIQKSHAIATVNRMLNHWINAPLLPLGGTHA